MLNDFTGADKVYIACGCTDLRKGIDGLARLVQQQFALDPFANTLFLFAGSKLCFQSCMRLFQLGALCFQLRIFLLELLIFRAGNGHHFPCGI